MKYKNIDEIRNKIKNLGCFLGSSDEYFFNIHVSDNSPIESVIAVSNPEYTFIKHEVYAPALKQTKFTILKYEAKQGSYHTNQILMDGINIKKNITCFSEDEFLEKAETILDIAENSKDKN